MAVQLRRQPGRLAGRAGASSGRSSRPRSGPSNFARDHGVTLVAALGNEHTDLGNPTIDDHQPGLPARHGEAAHGRQQLPRRARPRPAESSRSARSAPSGKKADYSNYGIEQTDFSAPGGYFRDFFGTPQYRSTENLVLSSYPTTVAIAEGSVDPDDRGSRSIPFVIADCTGPRIDACTYWQYLQGTSMASPHAAGVAALVVSAHGKRDKAHGGLTLAS